ncbi:MAG: histidine kinase dimerization/phosphoacceptor domain -containing protein [Euryarchaeota archaeon]|nr:histidine kinase dimerization/phosphoacceptor domain -containing protein [Euryarchaeota archaeon]
MGFEPDAFDGNDSKYVGSIGHDSSGRFVPYWNNIKGVVDVEPLVYYDSWDYYQLPKQTKHDVVTEPYLYQGALMVSYDSPIIQNGEFFGIGGVDVSLNYVDEAVSDVKIFDTGHLFMVSNTGILLSHPTRKDWIGTKKLSDIDNQGFSKAAEDIQLGVGGHINTVDPSTGENVIVFYEPIETGNFSILLAVPEQEMFAGVTSLRNILFSIYIFSIVFMGVMAYLIASSFTNRVDEIVADFRKISGEAVKGNLDVRANTDVEIDFKLVPVGLNEILDSLQDSYNRVIKMEAAVNNSPTIVFWWKAQEGYPVEYVSENIRRFGYSPDDFLSEKLIYSDLVHPDEFDQIYAELEGRSREGWTESHQEYRIITREGDVRWVHEDTFIQRDQSGDVSGYQGVIHDITEQKNAEDALISMENIRTKEVHHRIKNNLQVVSGMLYLESLNFEDQDVVDTFRKSEDRVRSIALIHEKLYRSKDLVSLDFADYIEDLIEYLLHSYNVDEDNIIIDLNVESAYLNMDTAIPLGIIVNELVSNALQHAFVKGEQGNVYIDFCREKDVFILSVKDSGGSFPDDLDFKNTESLGLQLVINLVSQIDGTVDLDTTNGTKFTVTFV